MTRKYYIPNVDILSDLKNIKKDGIIIKKGIFEIEYKDIENKYDSIITVFSTDEVKNLINFTEIANKILKKGGIWINFGGLNNIYSNFGGIDLTWDDWKHVILQSGFMIKREETPVVPFCKIEGYSIPYTVGTIFFTAEKI